MRLKGHRARPPNTKAERRPTAENARHRPQSLRCGPSGDSRRGGRSPRLCGRTVRERCPSHGASHVWCLSRTPSACACRLLQVAIPMEQWPVRGVSSPPWCSRHAMIDVQPVSGVERVSARGPAPVLSLQESRDSRGDARLVCTPATPGDVLAIVGAAPPVHVHVPLHRRLAVATPSCPTGSRPAVPWPVFAPPVLLVAPCQPLGRLATPDPRPAWWAPRCVHRLDRLVTTDR